MMDSTLTAKRVDEVFIDCLFREEEDTTDHVLAEGVTMSVGFHPGRLLAHGREIAELLGELPTEFMKSGGGGWSFLNACNTRDGEQWGEHRNMEQLFMLGLASERVSCSMPREMWSALPGGMPYYVVLDEVSQEEAGR